MRFFALAVVLATVAPGTLGLNCSSFDPQQIKIITFDTFAALMATEASLSTNIQTLLPELNASAVQAFVQDWVGVYGSYFGTSFNPATQAPEPFTWVIRTGLVEVLTNFGLITQYPVGSSVFELLAVSWAHLTPWPNTAKVLRLLQSKYLVAALSNGDHDTLVTATSAFFPEVQLAGVYSSDYPVGVFKPLPGIYEQVANEYGFGSVLHVAGSSVDAWGARSYGIYAALLGEAPQPGPQPCFLLKDITYLPAVMGL